MAAAPAVTGSIGNQIRVIMETEGITLSQVSADAGVDIRTLSADTKAARPVALKTALKICDAYQISMDWLLGLTDRQEPIRGRYNTAHDIETVRKIFSRHLRSAALRSGYSTISLADKVGITSSTVSHHMNANISPRTDVLVSYCKALGVSADWLLGRMED